jgi:7,8-dihydropterin-6-yl-methyl-4-(beta-D-ribofuranosyl)aminobenzene 5'-phosphate synthase
MHAESLSGSETRNLLMDFGFTPEALSNNISLLAVNPSELDALVLSHGHYDHFGGLVGFLHQNKDTLKAKLPFTLVERSASARANGSVRRFRAISARSIARRWNRPIWL